MYTEQWNEYRKRRFVFWCVLLGVTPFVFLSGCLLDQILPVGVSNPAVFALVGASLLAYTVAGIRLTFWRCPRCQKHYFVGAILVNQLASRCLHCGLEKWEEGED